MPTPDTRAAFVRATLAAVCSAYADGSAPEEGHAARPAIDILMLAARLAHGVGTPERAAALTWPGALGVLTVRSGKERTAFLSFEDLLLAGIIAAALPDMDADVPACVVEPGTHGGDRSTFRGTLDAAIAKGTPVFAVVSDPRHLTDAAQCLDQIPLTLPPYDADIFSEATCARFGLAGEPDPDWFRDAPAALFRLPAAALAAAFKAETADGAVRRLHDFARRSTQQAKAGGTSPQLADLHLPASLTRWCADLQQDLADHAAGRIGWEAVSASLFLHGPPGTGKTSAAIALANTLGLAFVPASYTDVQSAGNLADYLKEMERRVDRAITKAPSLILFDEFGSFARRTDDHGRNTSYVASVVNGMLQTLTRLANAPGVVVAAATNHPNRVDPALLRAGRFDTHIALPLPGVRGIETILRKRLARHGQRIDLAPIARGLVGASGADAERVARQAMATARRAGRAVKADDLSAAAATVGPDTPDTDLSRVALHEAGHIAVRAALGLPPVRRAVVSAFGGHVEADVTPLLTRADVLDLIAVFLGGRAAERHCLGKTTTGAESDLMRATELALSLDTRFGLGPGAPLYRAFSVTRPEAWPEDVQARATQVIAEADNRAASIIARHVNCVEAVSAALLAHRELDADQLQPLLRPVCRMVEPADEADRPAAEQPAPRSPATE